MNHFITYGNDNYHNSKIRIANEARNFGFDTVTTYGPESLTKEFLDSTSPHINHPRGGGYWLWKSIIIKNKLESINDGDILVYADAGCHINIHGKQRFNEYLNMFENTELGILSFELTGLTETMYTNESVFDFFGIGEGDEMRNSSQLSATILIMKKNDHCLNLIDELYKISTTKPEIFSDIHNNYKRHKDFRDHRHDQSVFGILRKKMGSVIIPDETWAVDFNTLMHIPILATRIRG